VAVSVIPSHLIDQGAVEAEFTQLPLNNWWLRNHPATTVRALDERSDMARRSMTPLAQFCWVDLMTPEVDRARAFYSSVFGWEAREGDPEFGGYFMFFHDGVPVAGGMPDMSAGQAPTQWTPYLAVGDAEASLSAVRQGGGTVVSDAMAVGSLGVMGVFVDPSGAVAGVWEPRDFPGFGAVDEPGAPRWFELHTSGFGGAKAFFEDAFGWSTSMLSDTDEFRYATANEGEAQFAGINDTAHHPGGPGQPRWLVYFGVESCDQAVAAARAGGATITMEPSDTPYGRLATITDPMGASFAVMQ